MLVLIGSWLVAIFQVFTGSGLHRYISPHLFWTEKRKKKRPTRTNFIEEVRDVLLQRKAAKFSIFQRCFDRSRLERFDQASERIDYQLDIVNFMKQQFMSQLVSR